MQFLSLQQPRPPLQSFANPTQPRGPPRQQFDPTMTAGGPSNRPTVPLPNQTSSSNSVSRRYFKEASAKRVDTDAVITDAIRAEHPGLHLEIVPRSTCDPLAWAQAGHAELTSLDEEKDRLRWRRYGPPPTRVEGAQGSLSDQILMGKFMLKWKDREYTMYITDGREVNFYEQVRNAYILYPSPLHINQLLLAAAEWTWELHDEVWVFDGGYWQKSREMYESIRKASWDDVILSQSQKDLLIHDVENFFNSKDTFNRLNVPWKRGVIFHGPPGNGKTVSIKAIMNMLYKRKVSIPTLYVKTLTSFYGPEGSLGEIFDRARRSAPCYLVFEDLDSIIQDVARSYFLNEVDGIQRNDGILMVGSTNHLDRLDPGIVNRPSRFDRKFFFNNPNMDERVLYMKYWQGKLDGTEVEMPDKMCPAIAKITKGFSFAYLQEAMVAALLIIARDQGGSNERTCLECMQGMYLLVGLGRKSYAEDAKIQAAHGKPDNGNTCDRPEASRPFKGLYDFVWTVRQTDDEDPDLDKYILWREVKKQIRILREEMDNEREGKRVGN